MTSQRSSMQYRLRTLLTQFSIRDILWLMVISALAASWWRDNKRIEATVNAVSAEHRAKQSELDDKLEIVNQMQIEARRRFGADMGYPQPSRRLKN
jgi:hypothetical protein